MFAFYKDKNKIKECRLPNGYIVKEENKKRKIVFDIDLGRYLWHPKRNDLFYSPFLKKIFRYLEWSSTPEATTGYMSLLCGYGKYKELEKKKTFWSNNLQIRSCVPIIKI